MNNQGLTSISQKICFIFFFGFFSCNAPKHTNASSQEKPYLTIAAEKYEGSIDYFFNTDSTRVLCVSRAEASSKQPRSSTSFFVYRIKAETIEFESSVEGEVSWYDDNRIEIFSLPGKMRNDQSKDDFTKIHDLETQKTWNKKEFLTQGQ